MEIPNANWMDMDRDLPRPIESLDDIEDLIHADGSLMPQDMAEIYAKEDGRGALVRLEGFERTRDEFALRIRDLNNVLKLLAHDIQAVNGHYVLHINVWIYERRGDDVAFDRLLAYWYEASGWYWANHTYLAQWVQ